MSDETEQNAVTPAAEQWTDATAPDGRRPDRWDVIRDGCSAGLLVIALVLPWNLSFGVGVPNSKAVLFAVLFVATFLSLMALAFSHVGPLSTSAASGKVRLALNVPYLLLVLGFVGFTYVESVRFGGDGDVPPGIGPGVLVGVAGAFLAAQPVRSNTDGLTKEDNPFRSWIALPDLIAKWAKFLALLSVVFNLYWRTRYAFPRLFDPSTAMSSIAVIATAVAYGVVALVAVIVGLRWLQEDEQQAHLATIALGISTLVAGVLVWVLPIGRDVDAFHGIAQNTSTAAVGFEGYLPWAAAAAIFGPLVLRKTVTAKSVDPLMWQEAARKCLLLIVVWCVGSAVLRVFDVLVAVSAGLPSAPYANSILLAFDLVTAAIAYRGRSHLADEVRPRAAVARLSGVLFALLICRVVLGVGLAPKILYSAPAADLGDAVYGNTLAHQITSTFDVVLCALALVMLAAALLMGRLHQKEAVAVPVQAAPPPPPPPPPINTPVVEEPATSAPEPPPESDDDLGLGKHHHRQVPSSGAFD